MTKRQIVTLCGSTKFKKEFEEMNVKFTYEGKIVLTVACFMHHDNIDIPFEQKERLDRLHLDKIAIADLIYVIDVDKYIGNSTYNEIQHAQKLGKPIRYWSLEH